MRRLIFGCDLKQLFLRGALKMDPRSFPSHPAAPFMLPVCGLQRDEGCSSPEREREREINLTYRSITVLRKVFCKRTLPCKCLLLLLCGRHLSADR